MPDAAEKVVLFGTNLSPYVDKVERALRLKKVEFETVEPNSPGDFKKWNPQTAKMPVLDYKGAKTFDSTMILRRIDQEFPEPPLFSRDAKIAAQQRQLEDWADESLYWMLMALRWKEANGQASIDQILDPAPIPGIVKVFVKRSVRKRITASTHAQGFGRLPHDVLIKEMGRALDDLVLILGDSRFFYGDQISAADLAVRGMLQSGSSGPTPEITRLIEERRALVDWCRRVDEQTSATAPGAESSEGA